MTKKQNNKSKLANWSPEMNMSPYLYGSEYPKYSYTKYQYKTFENPEDFDALSILEYKSRNLGKIGVSLELWDLHLIDNPQITLLLKPIYYIDENGKENYNYFEILDEIKKFFDTSKPIQIYFSYPLSVVVEAFIFLLKQISYSGKSWDLFPLGYISWQISKIYEDIFKNEFEETGVWGHGRPSTG